MGASHTPSPTKNVIFFIFRARTLGKSVLQSNTTKGAKLQSSRGRCSGARFAPTCGQKQATQHNTPRPYASNPLSNHWWCPRAQLQIFALKTRVFAMVAVPSYPSHLRSSRYNHGQAGTRWAKCCLPVTWVNVTTKKKNGAIDLGSPLCSRLGHRLCCRGGDCSAPVNQSRVSLCNRRGPCCVKSW